MISHDVSPDPSSNCLLDLRCSWRRGRRPEARRLPRKSVRSRFGCGNRAMIPGVGKHLKMATEDATCVEKVCR